jgi:hypothetical protein
MGEGKLNLAQQRAIAFANKHGGYYYDKTIEAIVPKDAKEVKNAWTELKNKICSDIGPTEPAETVSSASRSWQNSACDLRDLQNNAREAEISIKQVLGVVASRVGGEANFGPGGRFAVKGEESLRRKVDSVATTMELALGVDKSDQTLIEDIRAHSFASMNDAIRGTVVVDSIPQFKKAVSLLKMEAGQGGWEVAFSNKFEATYPTGYIGLHAKVTIPCSKGKIMGEVQIHFRDVNDGTHDCTKETQHRMYEVSRLNPTQSELSNQAGTLLYASAMEEVINKS